MSTNPLLQFDFLSLWHGQKDPEKALVMWTWVKLQDREPEFDLPMADGVGPVSQEVLKQIGRAGAEHMGDLYEFFEAEFKAKRIWVDAKASWATSWLADLHLMGRDAFVGAGWELQAAGAASLRVSAVAEYLSERGRSLSNPAAIARNLSDGQDPLIEILTGGAGRAGLTFRLTARGMTRGEQLHAQYGGKT